MLFSDKSWSKRERESVCVYRAAWPLLRKVEPISDVESIRRHQVQTFYTYNLFVIIVCWCIIWVDSSRCSMRPAVRLLVSWGAWKSVEREKERKSGFDLVINQVVWARLINAFNRKEFCFSCLQALIIPIPFQERQEPLTSAGVCRRRRGKNCLNQYPSTMASIDANICGEVKAHSVRPDVTSL